jgi:hypothetical protein
MLLLLLHAESNGQFQQTQIEKLRVEKHNRSETCLFMGFLQEGELQKRQLPPSPPLLLPMVVKHLQHSHLLLGKLVQVMARLCVKEE